MSIKLEAALDAARRGFNVFPIRPYVHPGEGATKEQLEAAAKAAKAPLIANWQNLATQDPRQLAAWWDEWPDANLATPTNEMIVPDVDPRNGGKPTFEMLALLEDWPKTAVSNTQGGGNHIFYAAPERRPVKGGTHKLGKGVDIKARGGYVLLPGSTIEGRAYTWENENQIALAPQWIVDKCKAAKTKTDAAGKRLVEEDDEARESFANWIKNHAPRVELGEIDDSTYTVAARGYDYGCGTDTVTELVTEWNETHCNGLGDADRLIEVCESAGRNRENAIGCRHPSAPLGFEVHEIDETMAPAMAGIIPGIKPADGMATALRPFLSTSLPLRPWVLEGFACRARVTLLAGPGGVAKSTYYLMAAVATVTGRADICGFKPVRRERVWLWNQEDDLEEMQRRLLAIMQAFNVSWADLNDEAGEPMLYLDSGVDRPLMLAKRSEYDSIAAGKQVVDVIATAKANKIAVVILDPLVEFHEASENDNVQMRAVLGQVRRIAVEANCAVMLATHTRKPPQASSDGFAGEMDAARGASSQLGVVRIGATIFSMSEKQAKTYGIAKGAHLEYVRIDIAKNNLAAVLADPIWFKREGVTVGGEGGESVGILRPVNLVKKAGTGAEVYLPEIAASIIAGKLTLGKYYELSAVLAKADAAQAPHFGEKSNLAKKIKAAFDGNDEVLTQHGKLALIVRPKAPSRLRLDALSTNENTDEDEA